MLQVVGARLVDADTDTRGWLQADGGEIVAVGSGEPPPAGPEVGVVDAGGRMLTPGLIDMHAHGCGGGAFEAGVDQIRRALAATARHGVTRSMVSLVTAGAEQLRQQVRDVAEVRDDPTGAAVLGVHLEGPCISPHRAGAHDPGLMQAPDPELIGTLADLPGPDVPGPGAGGGLVQMVTIAPELPGAMAAISALAARGIVVAVGHTEADHDTTRRAFDAGARVLTHAFNAMPGIHHRAPGPVVAALQDPRVGVELILDGVHVHDQVAQLLWQAAPGRVALITDAIAAAGAGDGDHQIGGLAVTVRDGIARLRGTDTIAGSTVTLDAAVRRAAALGVGWSAAVRAATAVPSDLLGLGDRCGRLAPGQVADLVLWGNREIDRVWRDGHELSRGNRG